MKIQHHKIFLHALRTGLILIATLLTYDLLKMLEREWNKTHPNKELAHFTQRKVYHFLIIFSADILVLYLIAILFDVHL
jgi:hypothetical protein